MSEPELLAYMTGTNEDFDLPRWHTQPLHDGLSSSAQAAQSAAQASYLYAPGPPQPPPQSSTLSNRLPPLHQSPTGSSTRHQPRITQIIDEDQQYAMNPLAYVQGNPLSRSVSLGGGGGGGGGGGSSGTSSSLRGKRHHPSDDLEGAFNVDNDPAPQRQPQLQQPVHTGSSSLYSSNMGYQSIGGAGAPSTGSGGNVPDPYQDAYFANPSSHLPKRSQTQHDPTTSIRAPRSPHRNTPGSANLLDPYLPAQNQYTTSQQPGPYPYSPTSDQQRSFAHGTYSQSHSRSHSQVKGESMSPALSPYPPPQTNAGSSSLYGPSYAMDNKSYAMDTKPYAMETTSPAPPPSSQQTLTAQRMPRQTSISQPTTPLSYGHSPQNAPSPSQFYGQDQTMAVEAAPPKRRASGLRRVRDLRDLRPVLNPQVQSFRRVDSSGTSISVSANLCFFIYRCICPDVMCLFSLPAAESTDYASRRDVSNQQSRVQIRVSAQSAASAHKAQ